MTEIVPENNPKLETEADQEELVTAPEEPVEETGLDSQEPSISEGEAAGILEALLFASDEPVSSARLKDAAPELQSFDIRKLVKKLNENYEKNTRSFHVESTAGGYQMFTRPLYATYIERMYAKRQQNRLSKKALETLAIVAYKQPVTRLQIEEIRGVSADGVVRTLLSRNLITIAGTAETPGTPYLYRTTRQFLEYFGLKNIKDLPKLKELDELVKADAELQEQVDPEILKVISPQVLGIEDLGVEENGTILDREEKTDDATDEDSEQEKDDSGKQ